MGAYLSSPVTDKESEDGECGRLRFGVSAMQGWRRSMEDAHLAVPAVHGDESAAVFGVFDGHGGREVARFVARHMMEELVQIGEYREGAYEAALKRVFHRMDEMLRQEEFDAELKSYKAGPRPAAGGGGGGGGGRIVITPNNPGGGGAEGEEGGAASAASSSAAMTPAGGGGSGGAGAGGSRLTAQEALEMLQKILVISSNNNANAAAAANASAANGPSQQQQRNGSGEGEEEGCVQQVPPPLLKAGDASPREGGGGEGEEDDDLRSPTPFEETGALKAQGIASPFNGGPRSPSHASDATTMADDDDFAASSSDADALAPPSPASPSAGAGAAREEGEVGMMDQVVRGEEGGALVEGGTEAIVMGPGAPAAAEEDGEGGVEEEEEEDEDEDEEESATIHQQGFPLRGGLGGSRMMCALPDHRVQAGCTSVVALLVGNELFVANAGDSRAVLSRGGTAVALSEDHKPLQDRELQRILRAGGFVTEQGRVNGNLNLSRSIGDLKYKGNTTLPPKDQMITAEPDVARITLQPEDEFLLLACDGVWDVMTNQEAIDFIRQRLPGALAAGKPVSTVAEELLDACLADDPRKSAGIGGDNFTCLIVQLKDRPGGSALAATGKRQSEGDMAGGGSHGSTGKAPRQEA